MNETDSIKGTEIPLGLGMAFAQNTDAMEFFSALTAAQQKKVVEKARQVQSKQEMQSLVDDLGQNSGQF